MTSNNNNNNNSRKLDLNRCRGGIDAPQLYINLDTLITVSTRPPAPSEHLVDKNDRHASFLRQLGAPQTIPIQNPLASSSSSAQNNNNDDDNDASSCFFSMNAKTLYVRTRPFASLFAQIITARVVCVVFSSLPQRLMDEILDRLQWTKYLRAAGVQFPSSSSSQQQESSSASTSSTSSYLTLPQIGVQPHSNCHSRSLILDITKSHWHPLLRSQIVLAPRQNLAKSLPRFIEPFGLLTAMNLIFDVINLYESSSSLPNATNTTSSDNDSTMGISISQSLNEISSSRFDSWKVFVPPSYSSAGSSNNNKQDDAASLSSTSAVDFAFLSDKVRMITASGGGKVVSSQQHQPNLWLYVGEVEAATHHQQSTSTSSSSSSDNKNNSNNNLHVPPPSMNVDLIRPAYFEACHALQIALPPALFSVSHSEAVVGHHSNKANTKFLGTGDTVFIRQYQSSDERFNKEVELQQQQGSSTNNKNFSFDQQQQQQGSKKRNEDSLLPTSASNNQQQQTSGTATIDLSQWWDWMSTPSPFPVENLHSLLSSASISTDEIKNELHRLEKLFSSSSTRTSSSSSTRTFFSHQQLLLLNPVDWVASDFPSIPSKLKEETYFVASWLLARCLAPFSKAQHWLPIRTLKTCLEQVKIEVTADLLSKVFDTTNIQLFGGGAASSSSSATPAEIRAKLLAASNIRPGLTFFVVAADGQHLARASTSGIIFSKYNNNNNSENSNNARSAIRFDQNYFKDCSTCTDGDERAKLPTKPEIAVQTDPKIVDAFLNQNKAAKQCQTDPVTIGVGTTSTSTTSSGSLAMPQHQQQQPQMMVPPPPRQQQQSQVVPPPSTQEFSDADFFGGVAVAGMNQNTNNNNNVIPATRRQREVVNNNNQQQQPSMMNVPQNSAAVNNNTMMQQQLPPRPEQRDIDFLSRSNIHEHNLRSPNEWPGLLKFAADIEHTRGQEAFAQTLKNCIFYFKALHQQQQQQQNQNTGPMMMNNNNHAQLQQQQRPHPPSQQQQQQQQQFRPHQQHNQNQQQQNQFFNPAMMMQNQQQQNNRGNMGTPNNNNSSQQRNRSNSSTGTHNNNNVASTSGIVVKAMPPPPKPSSSSSTATMLPVHDSDSDEERPK